MVVADQTFEIYAGNKVKLAFTLLDKDQEPAVPLDLTGRVLKFTLSKINATTGEFPATPKLEKKSTVGSEIVITNAPGGECEVNLNGADTDAFLGEFHFELEEYDPGGVDLDGVVLATGTCTILKNLVNT